MGFGNKGSASGSVSIDKSQITSDYLSVTEQSGLKAGDGGFNLKVKGNTDLIGGVISSTDKAVEENKNRFEPSGTLTLTDLENKAHYEAESISINVGTSANFTGGFKPSGNSVGIGNDKGEANSSTQSGISDIAGNKDVRSDAKETGIGKIFDKDKVLNELAAQTQITQLFGQQASTLVGDYAQSQTDKAKDLYAQSLTETDATKKQALKDEADRLMNEWGADGSLRIAAHALIGGLTGNLSGAAGAALGTLTAAEAARHLKDAGITQESNPTLYNALVALAGTAAGAIAGGTAGAGAAFNEATNNYLKHTEVPKYLAAKKALDGCKATGSDCSKELNEVVYWEQVSVGRDDAIKNCTKTNNCVSLLAEAKQDFYDLVAAKKDALGPQTAKEMLREGLDLHSGIQGEIADIRDLYDILYINAMAEYVKNNSDGTLWGNIKAREHFAKENYEFNMSGGMLNLMIMGSVGAAQLRGMTKEVAQVAKQEAAAMAAGNDAPKGTNQNTNLIPDDFTTTIQGHNSQVGEIKQKSGSILGAHEKNAFLESIEQAEGKITNAITDSRYPGLVEYRYQIPSKVPNGDNIGFKPTQTKTTYDQSILSDSVVTDMSTKAAQKANDYFNSNPMVRQHSVQIDG